jgi:hypothetical protein
MLIAAEIVTSAFLARSGGHTGVIVKDSSAQAAIRSGDREQMYFVAGMLVLRIRTNAEPKNSHWGSTY